MRQVLLSLGLAASIAGPAWGASADFALCGPGPAMTCVMSGDTVWFEGTHYRFVDIDAPDSGEAADCIAERLLARRAAERLAELLSATPFTIDAEGEDHAGRVLARFRIGDTTAGKILIDEGLGLAWHGPLVDWCG